MLDAVLAFLAILNPFALFLYLRPTMKDLPTFEYSEAIIKASMISLAIFLLFAIMHDVIFGIIFNIDFESFRIFGGIVIFAFAFLFIVRGQKAFIQLKGSVDDLASEIALPYMVGAGTISLSILMREDYGLFAAGIMLVLIIAIHTAIVIGLHVLRRGIDHKPGRAAFDHVMEIMLRISGFFLGAIGVDMILVGLRTFF